MQWYESDVQALEKNLERWPPSVRPVVFYGSSSIRLWTTLEEDFADVATLNLGFGGSTLAACSWFYWRLVRPICPKALVVYAGDNDLGDGVPPAEVAQQLGFLMQQVDVSAPGIPLTVIAIKPSPVRWSIVTRIEEANLRMQALVAGRPRSYWVDVFHPMLQGGQPRTELFADDGLHLSAAGYALWKTELSRVRPEAF
jgi:lysophospholipase L1-like esterase